MSFPCLPVGRRRRALAAAPVALVLFCGTASGATYNQAPMLDEAVAKGDLPPVEERLPKSPRVLEPLERIGTYGGTWRTGSRESAETWTLRTVGYDLLVHWAPDWSGVVPNIVDSWEVNDDATVYTLQAPGGDALVGRRPLRRRRPAVRLRARLHIRTLPIFRSTCRPALATARSRRSTT